MKAQMPKCKLLGYRCLPHRLSPMAARSNISDGLRPYYLRCTWMLDALPRIT